MRFGKTTIRVLRDGEELGQAAGEEVAQCLRRCLAESGQVRMMLAGGESQNAFQDSLTRQGGIAWDCVTCFQMDEFWCPNMPEGLTVGAAIQRGLIDRVRPRTFHRLDAGAADPDAEAKRFEALVRAGPIDILCQGIGTSGHLAFNEPGCDLEDPRWVRVITICDQSKRQLMADANFGALGRIPDQGITTTIPALMSAANIFTIVPLATKRPILRRVLAAEAPTADLPATILRRFEGVLFLDRDSCPESLLP